MQTGVIGLGAMGSHMATNLYKAGYLHKIWNRSPEKATAIANQIDINIAQSPEQLAEDCDLIIICVSKDADVLSVVQRISVAVKPGTIVVDTSTVSASTAKAAANILYKREVHFLDCPVSGGVEGAKNASLAMMVGGEQAILDKIMQVLGAIANNIIYIGDTGSGQKCKAVNQMMVAGINQAVTEALAFGELVGLDMDKVIDIVGAGAAANWFLEHRGKTMLTGHYRPGFKLSLHHKDLLICQQMLKDICTANLPIVEMTLVHYQRLINQGLGDEDISALFLIKREQLLGSRKRA